MVAGCPSRAMNRNVKQLGASVPLAVRWSPGEVSAVVDVADLVYRENCVAYAKDHDAHLMPQVPFLYDSPDRLSERDATLRLGPGLPCKFPRRLTRS